MLFNLRETRQSRAYEINARENILGDNRKLEWSLHEKTTRIQNENLSILVCKYMSIHILSIDSHTVYYINHSQRLDCGFQMSSVCARNPAWRSVDDWCWTIWCYTRVVCRTDLRVFPVEAVKTRLYIERSFPAFYPRVFLCLNINRLNIFQTLTAQLVMLTFSESASSESWCLPW